MPIGGLAISGLVLQCRCAGENIIGLGPGLLLRVSEDRPHRQAEARRRPAVSCGGGAYPRGDIADLRIGFAPQRKSIGVLGGHLDGGIRAAADEGVDAAGMVRLHLRKALLDLVIFAVVIERLLAGPRGADDVEEFAGPRIALILVVERVAILTQFAGVAAGDDVKRHAATGKLVQRRKLAREQRRRGKARPLRDHDL